MHGRQENVIYYKANARPQPVISNNKAQTTSAKKHYNLKRHFYREMSHKIEHQFEVFCATATSKILRRQYSAFFILISSLVSFLLLQSVER